MTTFPRSPRLLKAGIVLIDPETAVVQRIITLQYNPESLSRSLEVKGMSESNGQAGALRLTGPPNETFTLDAMIDATDQLEFPSDNPDAVETGIYPHLAALETIIYPTSSTLQENNTLAQSGTLEIAPMQMPLTLFIWSKQRVIPVTLTSFSVTEDAFDVNLNPIQAKVSLGMRVLTIDDLGFDHKGSSLYMVYQQQKENLSAKMKSGGLDAFGIGGIQ